MSLFSFFKKGFDLSKSSTSHRHTLGNLDGKKLYDLKDVIHKVKNTPDPDQKRAALYSSMSNLGMSTEHPNVLDKSFGRHLPFLRDFFDISTIDKVIVGRRQQQARLLSNPVSPHTTKIGWRITHRNADDRRHFHLTDEMLQAYSNMERLITDGVNRKIHPNGFKDVLSILVHDQLVYDRKSIVIQQHSSHPGRPGGYYCVDPVTIKPITTVLWEYSGSDRFSGMSKDQREAQIRGAYDQLSQEIGRPIDDVTHVQIIDGRIAQAFTEEEVRVGITNPSNRINGMGWSQGSLFDFSYELGEVLMHSIGFNREIFDPKYPEVLLTIKDDSNPNIVKDLQERITAPGSQRYTKIGLFPVNDAKLDINMFKLIERPMDMVFRDLQLFYIQLKASAFGMDISELNLPAENDLTSDEKNVGLESLLNDVADFVTNALISPWEPNLKLEFVPFKNIGDNLNEELERETRNWMTINEARLIKDLPPIKGGDVISNSFFVDALETLNRPISDINIDINKTH